MTILIKEATSHMKVMIKRKGRFKRSMRRICGYDSYFDDESQSYNKEPEDEISIEFLGGPVPPL